MAPPQPKLPAAVQALLAAPDRYDPQLALEPLRACLRSQVDGEWYDADANTALLRLFQSNPALATVDDVYMLLAKAFMQLPDVDFALAMMLLPASIARNEKVVVLLNMWELLQQAKFADFWTLHTANKVTVPGFVPAIQRYILQCVSLTFKEIPSEALCDYLGVKSLSALNLKVNEVNQVVLEMPSEIVRHTGNDFQLSQFSALIAALKKNKQHETTSFGQVSPASLEALEVMHKAMKEVSQ